MKLFGTDGIRGKANVYPMTPEVALRMGQAAAEVFGNKRPKFVIGKDTRLSGYLMENALASGILSAGGDVLLVGPMPSPAVAHLTKSFAADAGIVISASHNPAHDNGIKFFSEKGIKLSEQTEKRMEDLFFSDKKFNVTGDKIGRAYRIDDAQGRYIEFVKSCIENRSLGLKICLDCANGAAYKVAPLIFSELGAEVEVFFNRPNGLNINKECGATDPEVISEKVVENSADVGIALDGDADRVIMVDEKGEIVNGDEIMAIAALDMLDKNLPKKTVVSTIYSNIGMQIALKKKGIKLVRTKVGDKHVIDEMLKKGYALGGEQSGHIIFSEHSKTGDGTLAALKILDIMQRKNKKLSELRYIEKMPQAIVNVEVEKKVPLKKIPGFMDRVREVEKELGEEGRVVIRYSGTQNLLRIMVEGKNRIKKHAEYIAEVVE